MKKLILDFLKAEDGWINLAIAGASALASLLGGRNKSSTSSTQDMTQTTNPVLDPEIKDARSTVLDKYLARLGDQGGYMSAFTGQGMKTINRTGDLKRTALENILAARGLGSSPAAAALLAKQESDVWGQQTDFLNQLPLVSRQLQNEDLTGLSSVIAASPYGQTSTSRGTSTGTGQPMNWSGAVGSGIENSIAAYLTKKKIDAMGKDN